MDAVKSNSGYVATCKWCSFNQATLVLENADLCAGCCQKVIWAADHPKLCDSCEVLFTDKEKTSALFSKDGLSHGLGSARVSAEEGCGLCRMILLQDPNPDPGRLLNDLSLFCGAGRKESPDWETGFAYHEDVDSFYFSTEPGQYSLTLSVSATAGNPAANFVSQRPIEDKLDAERTNEQIKGWLKECLETHEDCQYNRVSFMPTRVIDVGDSGNLVKLVNSSTIEGEYVALSYCWVREPFLTTNLANLEQHQQSIKLSSMPTTFQDAIATTRNLGFKYIWIDALCIIQDSSEDKTKEISVMGSIYTQAAITIASVSGTRVADGFLKTTPQVNVSIPYRCPSGEIGQVEISPQITVDLWQEPLYTRGWCLQENLLSKRILLYTRLEVVWQCQSTPMRRPNTTHVSYIRDNPSFGASAFRRLPSEILIHGAESFSSTTTTDKYRIWTSIVANYTRRKLTVPSDRLPALDGIAQSFKVTWSDEYYYGIWKQLFEPSLGWYRNDQINTHERFRQLDRYLAPSWSWASIDGPVSFNSECKVHNSKITGAVLQEVVEELIPSEGSIYLKAKLEASIIRVKEFLCRVPADGYILILDNHDHRAEDEPWPKYGDRFTHLDEEMMGITWLMLLREEPDGAGKQEDYCFGIDGVYCG